MFSITVTLEKRTTHFLLKELSATYPSSGLTTPGNSVPKDSLFIL
jgi:hypothetical protein